MHLQPVMTGRRRRTTSAHPGEQGAQPILAAVDGSAASRAAVVEAVRLAGELAAPIVFVYVRRGPAGFLGAPVYERRLTAKMARARGVLQDALASRTTPVFRPRLKFSRAFHGGASPNSLASVARGSSSSARAATSWGRACQQA
jgi:nucleotide-binding universal stress UspA family protein